MAWRAGTRCPARGLRDLRDLRGPTPRRLNESLWHALPAHSTARPALRDRTQSTSPLPARADETYTAHSTAIPPVKFNKVYLTLGGAAPSIGTVPASDKRCSLALKSMNTRPNDLRALWDQLRSEVIAMASAEPLLANYLCKTIIDHASLIDALAELLAGKLASQNVPTKVLVEVISNTLRSSSAIQNAIALDLLATSERDPASKGIANPFLNYKGFHALEAYRAGHALWLNGRQSLAYYFQGRISEVFSVDIHPAAIIGYGVFIDHGTGIVIGETAVVDNDVSILQEVTLGGTGKASGDRHPKIGRGVLIGAGAKILGNIRVGERAKIGAGSVVLQEVPPHTTVAGVPARVVGHPKADEPGKAMDQDFDGESEG